ncbi:18225_t:CDS:2, partial [Racocetra fulgida]
SDASCDFGAPCGDKFRDINQTTITTFPSEAGATVGTQGILQTYFIHGNDTSPINTTWYQCSDIKIIDELNTLNKTPSSASKSSAVSINAPH